MTEAVTSSVTAPAKILVIDDNEANRSLALNTLEDEGYRVVLANGGVDGIAAFVEERPDCILLDVRMPEMDGFAVCERIRGLPDGDEVPVIFLTAQRDVETFDRALLSGGNDFLGKPVRPTELVLRVRAALRLRKMSSELHEHYAMLKHQRDALMRLQFQKERLTAFVVHDLKNPVNVIGLHAQYVLMAPDLPSSVRDSMAKIRVEVSHLSGMILNLLDVSKADEGKLVPTIVDVDLRALTDALVSAIETSARAHHVTIDVALDVHHVRADEDLLRRVMTNLVENALRHAPKKSVVHLTSSHVAGAAELRVRDAGAGIPLDMREKIFDPFTQLEDAHGPITRGGRGLGLTFCKLAVEALGGEIGVEDGRPGAIFCVKLPASVINQDLLRNS